jgi:hypothetical protein
MPTKEQLKRVQEWRENHPGEVYSPQKQWKLSNPDKLKIIQWRGTRSKKHRALSKIVNGGQIECFNCGCTDERILEINHKNGDGRMERRIMGKARSAGVTMWNAILYHGRGVDDLDIRCRVCNALYYIELKYPETGERIKVRWD